MIFLETIQLLTFIKQTIGSEMFIQLVKHYPLENFRYGWENRDRSIMIEGCIVAFFINWDDFS